MRMRATRGRRWLPLGIALLAAATAAVAQPASPAPAPAPAAPAADGFELPSPPVSATATPEDDLAPLLLRAVRFEGNTVLPDAALEEVAARDLGQRIGAAGIERLRQRLTQRLVDGGWINSGVLVERVDVAAGRIDFRVIEGRLAGIELRGMDGLHDGYLIDQLVRPDDGPLDMDRLRERFQLALADPLIERMNARLMPGMQPGEAVLAVDVVRSDPYRFSLFANNHRPVSIGAAAVGVAASARNLTGRGDLLELTLQSPLEGDADLRAGAAWRLPFGGRRSELSLRLDHGDSAVRDEAVRNLDIRSRLGSAEIGLAHAVSETLGHRFALGAQAIYRENRTWLLGRRFSFNAGEPDGLVRERIGTLWQELVLRSADQVLALRSTFGWGENNLRDIPGMPAASRAPTHFRTWLGQLQFTHRLRDTRWQAHLRATVQRSPDRLLALDRIAIGGARTVRGHRENQLVRDQGHWLNLELEIPLVDDRERELRFVAAPFYDHGRGRNHGEPATTLNSLGVALRATWQRFDAELVLAKRIDPPPQTGSRGANLQDRGVHLQVVWRF